MNIKLVAFVAILFMSGCVRNSPKWILESYSNGQYTLLHSGHRYHASCVKEIVNGCTVLLSHIGESINLQQGEKNGTNSDLLFLKPFDGSPIPEGWTPDLVALKIISVE
jgi:hypothetical protein